MIVNVLFLCEIVFVIIVHGFKYAYRKYFKAVVETINLIITITALVKIIKYYHEPKYYTNILKLLELTIFIRLLRLLALLNEFKRFRIINETLKNLMGPFWAILCVMFTIFYIFGLIGLYMFGGLIST